MPNWLASIFTTVRDLFGALLYASTAPDRSPPGVDTEIVPVVTREVIFASAARPPIALRCFSTMSSAVCADARAARHTMRPARAQLDSLLVVMSLPFGQKVPR